MKKLIAISFFALAIILLASSCRSHESCPAYKNGSAQKPAVEKQHKV